MAPDGYQLSDMPLTAEHLLDATIYGPTGDAIGDVHDLILGEAGHSDMQHDPAMAEGAMDGATSEDMAMGETEGAMTDPVDQTETGASAGVEMTNPPDMDAENTMDDEPRAADLGETATTATPGHGGQDGAETLSHAILDIGGFLGLGEHRVAVPVSDLQIYQNADDVRVYLPWTEEQLEELPEYVEGDMATYGRSLTPRNTY
ncbi:hypothetical protein C4N9_01585 [Pararhodobacter marinus]|uniref:PRC-barrel domain-containing protein n=1 Tax=Pararhodobacter marinus TaxID=2184063 RepID=A0A2U2CIM0_9RHOB|nr:hypothetical protein C4N9_01585 [Pararhodobacter marinus]